MIYLAFKMATLLMQFHFIFTHSVHHWFITGRGQGLCVTGAQVYAHTK